MVPIEISLSLRSDSKWEWTLLLKPTNEALYDDVGTLDISDAEPSLESAWAEIQQAIAKHAD